jgi:hypothetical protein
MATDRLIHWICTARDHSRTTELGLTRHDGRWAMCPELIGDGHEWQETGGVELSDAVRQWQRELSTPLGSTPSPAS